MRALAFSLVVPCLGCNAIFGVEPGKLDAGMIHVQGEPFDFSLEVDQGGGTNQVASTVHVDLTHAFALDEDEVTVARFEKWLSAGQKVPADGATLDVAGGPYATSMRWSSGLDGDAQRKNFVTACKTPDGYQHGETTSNMGNGDYPMTCVTWAQAAAFCAFDGKRLPTNAEWQFAAQGGNDARKAPFDFSGTPTCADAIINPDNGSECGFPVAVGTATGTSKDGVLDMGGSVIEWTWDAFNYGANEPLKANEDDGYAGIGDNTANHLLRGGEYFTPAKLAETQNGHAFAGDQDAVSDVGFRCARTLLPP